MKRKCRGLPTTPYMVEVGARKSERQVLWSLVQVGNLKKGERSLAECNNKFTSKFNRANKAAMLAFTMNRTSDTYVNE